MRTIFFCLAMSLAGTLCFGQADTAKIVNQEPVQRQVAIPGIDTPTSGPGLTAQMPINTSPPPQNGRKNRKTQPPSDPRSFGVSVPLGKAKKDTLRN